MTASTKPTAPSATDVVLEAVGLTKHCPIRRRLRTLFAPRRAVRAVEHVDFVLRKGRVTTALIGASRPEQVEDCVGALKALDFSDAELAEIDTYARESDINLWAASAERKGPPRK